MSSALKKPKNMLQKININNWNLENGKTIDNIPVFYQVFGQSLGTSPVVLVNHALTGNSHVIGEKGWWNDLIGKNKTIETNFFSVLSINIPGNGFDGNAENLIENYKDFTIRDIANIYQQELERLHTRPSVAIAGYFASGHPRKNA